MDITMTMNRLHTMLLMILFEMLCMLPAVVLLEGRYTRNVNEYDLLVPFKATSDGNFLSYSLAHFFGHEPAKHVRRKRDAAEADVAAERPSVSYGVTIDGRAHHVDLWPNHQLLSPAAVVERRSRNVANATLHRFRRDLCHFVGRIRGMDGSKVAISTCDGLSGYISIEGKRYFIEPLKEHTPNKRGQHLHMVYRQPARTHFVGPRCGTKEDWKKAWKQRLRSRELGNRMRAEDNEDENYGEPMKRGSLSVHRYLECLIVVDKKFLQHHRNTDYETYILTVMNMVSDYYHDASVGHQMEVVVVRVMYLEKEEEEIDLVINQDSDKTLESFCKWQQTVNPRDIRNPNHHDIAVLLTRYDLCADSMANCGLMGLAYVAAACTQDKPCAINEDAGLIVGIVVAHEIGHVMGCSHDTENDSGCKAQADDQSFYVMSPFVHLHTNIWSTCSRTFITTFFDNDLGECLNDVPEISLYPENYMLPGTIYDAAMQCRMEFPGSSVCKSSPSKFCDRLLCRTAPGTCMSNGEPPVDGTVCGENKWCYDKKCVEIGERPAAINGGWGEWGQFSQCSRTCGGGVQISERDCNHPPPQHRGRYCLGERRRVKICNTEMCPQGVIPFRAVQCSAFDDKPFQEKLYRWRPFPKDDEPCSLYCLNDDNVFVKLAPRVKDGTRCKAGTKNMCISGVCRVVGCDFVVDSDAVEDDCGVCKGDGSECKIVEHTFQAPPGKGYVKVAVIFRGCRNIVIEELRPSVNTIAIAGPDEKHFYLNADFSEMPDGERQMGGTEGIYSHPEPNQELLVIHGPLRENIVLFVVFYANENVGYRYRYAEPSPRSNYQPTYHWEIIVWSECDARCGGGLEYAEPKCIEEKAGLVASSFCQVAEKPPTRSRRCNEFPCPTKWRIGKWGPCMACKNIAGLRMREVECVREAPRRGADDILVDDAECGGGKPGTKELCSAQGKCTNKRQYRNREELIPPDKLRRVWLQTVVHVPLADLRLPEFLGDTKNIFKIRHDMKHRFTVKRQDFACPPNQTTGAGGVTGGQTGGATGGAAGGAGGGNSSEDEKNKKKPDLKVGTIVKDPIDPEQMRLIEIPLMQVSRDINITDVAFEAMGDQVPDTIDEAHEKVYKGEEAAKLLEKLEHGDNNTCTTSEST